VLSEIVRQDVLVVTPLSLRIAEIVTVVKSDHRLPDLGIPMGGGGNPVAGGGGGGGVGT